MEFLLSLQKYKALKTSSWHRLDNQNTMEFLLSLQKYKALKTSSWHRLDNQNTMEFLLSLQKYKTLKHLHDIDLTIRIQWNSCLAYKNIIHYLVKKTCYFSQFRQINNLLLFLLLFVYNLIHTRFLLKCELST
jgi:hypothetical protein